MQQIEACPRPPACSMSSVKCVVGVSSPPPPPPAPRDTNASCSPRASSVCRMRVWVRAADSTCGTAPYALWQCI